MVSPPVRGDNLRALVCFICEGFFFKINKNFQNVQIRFDVLGQNCLQSLLADDTSRLSVKEKFKGNRAFLHCSVFVTLVWRVITGLLICKNVNLKFSCTIQ